MEIIYIYLIIVNVISFLLFGIDKNKAKKNDWRIKESTLFKMAIIGGSIGALIGMKVFRHKTKKASFIFIMIAIILSQFIVLYMLLN